MTSFLPETVKVADKIAVIRKALKVNKPDPKDGLDVLAKVGGLEIAAIAGLVLGCAANSIPVVIDGFISTAGALIASRMKRAPRRGALFFVRAQRPRCCKT